MLAVCGGWAVQARVVSEGSGFGGLWDMLLEDGAAHVHFLGAKQDANARADACVEGIKESGR
eukprot:625013-Rhodomonas_salina.1